MTYVIKFGGTSVKDAAAMKNVVQIIKNKYSIDEGKIIVISAIANCTNQLENIARLIQKKDNFWPIFTTLKTRHLTIIDELFGTELFKKRATDALTQLFQLLKMYLEAIQDNQFTEKYWGQITSYGELFSSTIFYYYLSETGIFKKVILLDAKEFIKTKGERFVGDSVDFEETRKQVKKLILPSLCEHKLIITQGFIASNKENIACTLGREGSDYSATILANALSDIVTRVDIWTDVDGVFTADPNKVPSAKRIDFLSYDEAENLALNGAKVLHPKTLEPIKNYHLPLRIRSSLKPDGVGSYISDKLLSKENHEN